MLDFGSPLDGIRSPLGPRRGRAFSPSTLFALAEPGVWFDPSDLTTLFTDPAGTTPVTIPGQTVGLMLDKSKGLALGAELVNDGTFSGGTVPTGWVSAAGSASVSGGQFNVVASGGAYTGMEYSVAASTQAGRSYIFEATLVSGTGRITVQEGVAGDTPNIDYTGPQTFRFVVQRGVTGNFRLLLRTSASGGTTVWDNISVRELAGNHATQAITAARPTYSVEPVGGRRNRILYSEQFNNAVFTPAGVTVSPDTAIAPDGTLTADQLIEAAGVSTHIVYSGVTGFTTTTISIMAKANSRSVATIACNDGGAANWAAAAFNLSAPGAAATAQSGGTFSAISSITPLANDWYRCVLSVTSSGLAVAQVKYGPSNVTNPTFGSWGDYSYTGVSGNGVFLWGAQLELGSTATNYQRVTTQHDVTEAGVASVGYLWFDGVNDAMATSTITPGTDKAQFFAGVRKLSSALSVLAELSVDADTNNGTLHAYSETNLYAFRSRGTGTSQASYTNASVAAPFSSVFTGIGDISGDIAELRLNGTQVAISASNQGTGDFLAYPLYIGARAGTARFLLGHLYSLITRFGPTLDAPTIASTETWVAGKTGIVI